MSLENAKKVVHTIKCRDDKAPVEFVEAEGAAAESPFEMAESSSSSWAKSGEKFGSEKLRSRIEPWLTSLFQTDHLSLLVGSGLTHAVHRMATDKSPQGMGQVKFGTYDKEISEEAKRTAKASGRLEGNLEDQIRVANELLRGLEILASSDKKAKESAAAIQSDLARILKEFAAAILKGEAGVITAPPSKREAAFNYLVSFLMSFASRTGTRDRLQIFSTNYERLLEAGADIAGLRLIDRFVGTLAPIFRSSRLDIDVHYNPPGIRGEPRYLEGVARFTKLHGSLDWVSSNNNIYRVGIPFGASEFDAYLKAPGLEGADATKMMIYPNSSKDRETAGYPYVELFRDFAAAITRPNSALVTYGYSFGDEHINRVIEDMLTIPSAHLVVISYDDPLGRIMQMYEKLGRHAQITLLIGSHLGDFKTLVDNYLPKPAIDRTTFRMAELLKSRWAINRSPFADDNSPPKPDGQGF
jgi:SIR2-like domain